MNSSQTPSTCSHDIFFTKSISWSAILTGALVGIGIMFLLNVFSIAIGLSVFPTTEAGVMSLAVGGLVGAILGSFISMFLAGWVAGYLARPFNFKRNLGVLYGFTTWSVVVILTVLLTTYVGKYITSYANFVTNPATIVSDAGQPVSIVAPAARSKMMVNITTQNIAMNVLVLFVLFYAGALGACFGGYYGMSVRCRSRDGKECTCCPARA